MYKGIYIIMKPRNRINIDTFPFDGKLCDLLSNGHARVTSRYVHPDKYLYPPPLHVLKTEIDVTAGGSTISHIYLIFKPNPM